MRAPSPAAAPRANRYHAHAEAVKTILALKLKGVVLHDDLPLIVVFIVVAFCSLHLSL